MDSERMVVDEDPDELGASVGLERTLVVVVDSDAAEPVPLVQGDLMRRGDEAVHGCGAARLESYTEANTCTEEDVDLFSRKNKLSIASRNDNPP